MRNIDHDKFSQSLLLTQRYCDLQLNHTDKNHAAMFRSINPVYDGKPLFCFTLNKVTARTPFYCFFVKWERDPYEEEGLMEELFNLQLKIKEEAGLTNEDKLYKGAVVVFEVNGTVIDGATTVSSFGLFDDYDCPPIDTWFYFQNGMLFAWIPEEFLSYVQEGIDVNCVNCIEWLAVKYPTLAAMLDVKNKWTEFIKNIDGLPPELKR